MNRLPLHLALILGTFSVGCATAHVQPEARFKGSWAENPEMDREIRKFLQDHNDELMTDTADPGIEVWVGKIPAGIEVREGVISVQEGVPYEILGKASVMFDSGSQFAFPDYEDGWRKGLCYWQVPVTWLTLGLWAVVPLNYPCSVKSPREKEDVLTATRNLVKKVGGHFFVGDYLFETEDHAVGVMGFVVRKLDASTTAPSELPVDNRTQL